MKIVIVGDTHNVLDLEKIKNSALIGQLDAQDVIIHCGDIGIRYLDKAYHFWNNLKPQIIVCLGNHEAYDWIITCPRDYRFKGWGYCLSDTIFAPMAGEILNIKGYDFWFYPGGYSIDYAYRNVNVDLFEHERLLKQESDWAFEKFYYQKIDAIISHDGPSKLISDHLGYPIGDVSDAYLHKLNITRQKRVHPGLALNQIYGADTYDFWFFGHHHRDFKVGRHVCVFNEIIEFGNENM